MAHFKLSKKITSLKKILETKAGSKQTARYSFFVKVVGNSVCKE
jgi:hypothetical protein